MKEIKAGTQVTFDAITYGDVVKVIIPKDKWVLAADDADFIYVSKYKPGALAQFGLGATLGKFPYNKPAVNAQDDEGEDAE